MPKLVRELPPIAQLQESFLYDPETGVLMRRSTGLPALNEDGWKRRYFTVRFRGRNLLYHRICFALLTGVDPYPLHIDHINRNPRDNRASNLRAVTVAVNNANRAPYSHQGRNNIRRLSVGEKLWLEGSNVPSVRAHASRCMKKYGELFRVEGAPNGCLVSRLA